MSANAVQQKAPWVLAALLMSQVVLMSTSAKHPSSEQSIMRTWLMTALTPVARGLNATVLWVKRSVSNVGELRTAREENSELRRTVEQLTAERDDAVERARQAEVFKSELASGEHRTYQRLAANVIARDASLWFRRLVIDRGSFDGVKQDMPVATATGIVGRIISVGPNYAVVQVITDKHAGVGAMLQESRAMGELRGRDPEDSHCELKNIPATENIRVGETLVTTGLDRIYPKGLVIGTVERVETDPNAPWYKIVVKPSAPVDRAEQVLVLLTDPKKLGIDEVPDKPR